MKTPESYEKDEIIKYLTSIGAWWFKPSMGFYGKVGVPDIVACLAGRFVGIEAKRRGKLPTPIQAQRLREINAAGGIALWGTAEKVIKELEDLLCYKKDQNEKRLVTSSIENVIEKNYYGIFKRPKDNE